MKPFDTRFMGTPDAQPDGSSDEWEDLSTEEPSAEELATRHIGPVPQAPAPASEGGLATRHISPAPQAPTPAQVPAPEGGLTTRHVGPAPQAPTPPSEQVAVEGRLPDGHVLQQRYRILGLHAVGGMSTVYKAQDMRFSKVTRLCIVKEMLSTTPDPQMRAMMVHRFEREANLLASLNHPGIVQIFDYFSEGDRNYLVEEFVDGRTLDAVLTEVDGFLPEGEVVSWAVQICKVLSYLHSHEPRPIVFRDIKPDNIMLDSHGRIRLVDFGIARIFESGQKGTMIGTDGYAPPEQYRGSHEPRVDIYALGATMHYLLSKQDPRLEPPFSFHDRPIHNTNPTVSRELTEIVDRALEYDVNKRFGSAEEMERALMALSSARGMAGTTAFGTSSFTTGDVMALWRFRCEDEVRSTPAVHNGVVFVGAYDNNLYAVKAENGEFLWKYPTEGGIASSPCVHGGRVFFGSADRLLYAINEDSGRIAWTCPTQGSIWSSPRVAFDHVFVGSDDQNLYAANVYSGRVVWKFSTDGKVRSSPTIGEDTIYVGCEAGMVYAVDTSGQARWRFRARRGVTSSPALTKELVYVGCQDSQVYAMDVRSGWKAWQYRTGGPVVSSPAVSGGLILIGSADGYLYALDSESGRLVWRYAAGSQVTSSPAVTEEAVYFGAVDGAIYSLDLKTGSQRWRFQADGPITSSPTIADGVIYIGSDDRSIYALPA